MHEPFIIPVVYQGEGKEFKARFERWGYTHRISVLVGETTVIFEPDEEGGYRAMPENIDRIKTVPVHLLKLIAEKLKTLSA